MTDSQQQDQPAGTRKATFGGGCFWCTEAVFLQLKGVVSVVSGYCGGGIERPTYEQICSGRTGHAEVVRIVYDPAVISYPELLAVFWKTHDPTTPNRQGNDVGTQYRSVVFYETDEERRQAEQAKHDLEAAGIFGEPIVTEIVPAADFYPAEDYHQDYFNRNPRQPYCQAVIPPKLAKLRQAFADRLK
jgi:peptide-methionine (S)-S-oxide reductase